MLTSTPNKIVRRLTSIADAANYYQCSPKTIRRRIADGSLTAYRLGRLIRVDLNELDDLASGAA